MKNLTKNYAGFKSALLILALLFISNLNAQIQFSGVANLVGFYSSEESLPFWFYSNQRGRISEETSVAGWISGKINYDLSTRSNLEIGAGVFYQDAFSNKVFFDELYADLKYNWLQLIVGRKQEAEMYDGLSATNENFAWSLNARPMPGIQLQTSRPVFFGNSKKLGFEFSWEEYLMEDDRFVSDAQMHHKSFHLIYQDNKFEIKGGIQHYVQWAGDSPERGLQPSSFSDYLRIISGREGGKEARLGDQQNALGNHLGVYELILSKNFGEWKIKLIYNHFFEDGSGSRFANFPDGRYGLYIKRNDSDLLFDSLMYEFYSTKHQKNNTGPDKFDAYFNNPLTYESGWTYQNRVIGVPFFSFDSSIPEVIDSQFIAHHIGFSGNLKFRDLVLPYRSFLTYIDYDQNGLINQSGKNILFYTFHSVNLLKGPFSIDLQLGADYNQFNSPKYSIGIKLSKEI